MMFLHKKRFRAGQLDSFSISRVNSKRPRVFQSLNAVCIRSVSSGVKELHLFSPPASDTGTDAIDKLAVSISSCSLLNPDSHNDADCYSQTLTGLTLRHHDSLLKHLRIHFLSSGFTQGNVELCSRTSWQEDDGAQTPGWSVWLFAFSARHHPLFQRPLTLRLSTSPPRLFCAHCITSPCIHAQLVKVTWSYGACRCFCFRKRDCSATVTMSLSLLTRWGIISPVAVEDRSMVALNF